MGLGKPTQTSKLILMKTFLHFKQFLNIQGLSICLKSKYRLLLFFLDYTIEENLAVYEYKKIIDEIT